MHTTFLRTNILRPVGAESLLTGVVFGIVTHRALCFGIGFASSAGIPFASGRNSNSPKSLSQNIRLRQTSAVTGMMESSPKGPTCNSVLNQFLSSSSDSIKRILNGSEPEPKNLTIVMGNEASDLDSMVSSVLLAYACSLGYFDNLYPGISRDSAISPIMNIPREDYALRQVHTHAGAI